MTSTIRTTVTAWLFVLATAIAVLGCKSEPPKPGQKEFDAANSAIAVYSNEVGFGSDAAATEMAKKYAAKVKALEAENFEGGKDAEKDAITKGNFLTYCHNQGNDIVFLVQVPNLDTYDKDVRKSLFEIAWEAGQAVTGAAGASKNMVIALRGKLLYGVIGKGKASGAAPAAKIDTSVDTSELFEHFKAAGAPAEQPAAK